MRGKNPSQNTGSADDPKGLVEKGQCSCAAYRGRQLERRVEYLWPNKSYVEGFTVRVFFSKGFDNLLETFSPPREKKNPG